MRCAGAVARDEVGDEPLLARRVFAGDHGDLADAGCWRERRLDLAELDAEAADLDLLVDAAEVFELAVVEAARQIAAAVQAAAAERVGDEALRR